MAAEVEILRRRVRELEEELAGFRARAATHDIRERARRLQSAFNLGPGNAALLLKLYDAGRPVAPEILITAVPPVDHARPRQANANVRVRISALRRALGDGAIEREPAGYVLTQAGRAEVEANAFLLPMVRCA